MQGSHKLDTSSCQIHIHDKLCKSVAALYINIVAGEPMIPCDIVCIAKDPYMDSWTEYRAQGYVEQIYSNSIYVVLKDSHLDQYFQQFIDDSPE